MRFDKKSSHNHKILVVRRAENEVIQDQVSSNKSSLYTFNFAELDVDPTDLGRAGAGAALARPRAESLSRLASWRAGAGGLGHALSPLGDMGPLGWPNPKAAERARSAETAHAHIPDRRGTALSLLLLLPPLPLANSRSSSLTHLLAHAHLFSKDRLRVRPAAVRRAPLPPRVVSEPTSLVVLTRRVGYVHPRGCPVVTVDVGDTAALRVNP